MPHFRTRQEAEAYAERDISSDPVDGKHIAGCGNGVPFAVRDCLCWCHGNKDERDISNDPVDDRAIADALGFDPTNHHNAARCPYCTPERDISTVIGRVNAYDELIHRAEQFSERTNATPVATGQSIVAMIQLWRPKIEQDIRREAVEPWRKALRDLMGLVRDEDQYGSSWDRAVELTDE